MKLANVAGIDSVDSKEEQDASVDNTCYMKLSSRFNLVVGLLDYNHFFSQCNMFSAQYYHMAPPISTLLYLNRDHYL